jgi:hypothetical protein
MMDTNGRKCSYAYKIPEESISNSVLNSHLGNFPKINQVDIWGIELFKVLIYIEGLNL